MINPAQYQKVLGQASDDQLMAMLRRPDKIPSQFIVAEINRRQAARQASKAQQAGMAQQMAQQPPSQMQQMQQQQMQMQPRGMNQGGRTLPIPKPSVGQRNNNPMNLRPVSGDAFFGTMGVSPRNYSRFSSDLAGLRAGFVNMATQAAQGVDTLNQYLGEYAPEGENPPDSVVNYKNFVADALGVGLDDKINLADPATQLKVADAQIKFENNADDDYYKSLKPLLPKALTLSQDKKNNPFTVASGTDDETYQGAAPSTGFSIIGSAQASSSASGQQSRPPIYSTIDALAASGDLNAIRSLEKMVTDPDFGNADIKLYARKALGSIRSGKGAAPQTTSRFGAGPSDAMYEKYGDSMDNVGNVQGIKPPDVMIGPDDANADFKNTARERNARQVLDDSLAGLQSLGRGNKVKRDTRDRVTRGGQPVGQGNFGAGPSDAMYEKYGDSMDNVGNVEPNVMRDTRDRVTRGGQPISNVDRFVKGRLFGGTDERPSLLGPEGKRLVDRFGSYLDTIELFGGGSDKGDDTVRDGRDSVGGSGIKPPENEAERLERMRKGFGGHGGARLDNTRLTEEVGPALSTATTDLLIGANNSTVGDVALDGAFDIPTLKGDLAKLSAANQKLVEDYNTGAAELIKQRKELMEQFEGQRRTPQNMMFKALIDFGLELASSPESNFLRAVAQAGKAGIASFDNLNKESQQQLYRQYKMAYDIAAAEFDHKIKGQKLAVDTGMQAVTIADTLSQIGYRSKMADAAIIRANRSGATKPPNYNTIINSMLGMYADDIQAARQDDGERQRLASQLGLPENATIQMIESKILTTIKTQVDQSMAPSSIGTVDDLDAQGLLN